MNNLKELVKVFNRFIEFGDSFVRVDEIVAIKAIHNHDGEIMENASGIEIITPHGTYVDTTETFESFKKRINDIKDAMGPVSTPQNTPTPTQTHIPKVIPLQPTPQLPTPIPQAQPKVRHQLKCNIAVDNQGGEGVLDVNANEKIVERQNIVFYDPSGAEVAQCSENGQVKGDMVSGFIYANGKYRIAIKNYPANAVMVCYTVEG